MDRPIVPSYLISSVAPPDSTPNIALNYSEMSLRTGIIEEILPPNHPQNRSKRHTEYQVGIAYTRGSGPISYTRYYNCVQMDTFGSFADTFQATLRKSTVDVSELINSKGARVLILCINDDTSQGVIIGSIPNNNVPPVNEDKGHHLKFEFNGVGVSIDDLGNVVISQRGATDQNGKVEEPYDKPVTSSISMSSDGTMVFQSNGQGSASVSFDSSSGKINLTCSGNVSVDCQEGVVVNCNGNAELNCGTGNGLVINEGTYSMVRGDNLIDSINQILTDLANSVSSIPTVGPAIAAAVNVAKASFAINSQSVLSVNNKVD